MNKAIDNELIKNQKLLLEIFDTISEGIAHSTLTGKILSANKSLATMAGLDKKELIGESVLNVVHKYLTPKNVQTALPLLGQLIRGKEIPPFTIEYQDKIIEIRCGINRESKRLTAVFRDITEQTRTEQSLRESEQKFRLAFHTNPDSINLNRVSDGLYIDINDGFTKLMGFTREEVIGKSSLELNIWHNPADRERLVSGLKQKGVVENLEALFRKKNGELATGLMSARILRINNEDVILNVTRDISERKQTLQELIAAKEKAEQSDKLKTAFLRNMSHEIRTPLNGILGFAELLNEEDITPEEVKKYSDIINSSSNRLLDLINSLIDISKIEAGLEEIDLTNISPDELIHDVVGQFEPLTRNRKVIIRSDIPFDSRPHKLFSDMLKLRQVLFSLISNSIRFTREGTITVGYTPGQEEIVFYVKDTGTGIPAELMERIFDRFYQADLSISRGHGGTGLGLSLCKGMIELLGGRIWAESEPGKGSSFYFTVPCQSKHRGR
ncbi:MAG: PAS domain-containing sensor histidine kinase [Bacteroidota bacterium]